MKAFFTGIITLIIFQAITTVSLKAQNPVIRDQFSADPTARVFDGRVWLFPSHDILADSGRGRIGWFYMEDYHVFSSSDLVKWTDHGVILSQYDVPWVDSLSYSLWAPDCIERNGKYYFYFPAKPKDVDRGFGIGVAVAEKPEGPYIPEIKPITGVFGIDPGVFIDHDNQAYLYYSLGKIFVAKLAENMLELASEPVVIQNLPTEGLIEGPFMFERGGKYYLTYPHVQDKIERLEYAMADHPLGPFTVAGVLMDESPKGCWTNHQSVIEYGDQWYLFYHQNDYSPSFDKARSVRIDSLFFNADGTIRKVLPTERGVGITPASSSIEIDRYSALSETGAGIEFMDPDNKFLGWKVNLEGKGAWIRYDRVDFGRKKLKGIELEIYSEEGGQLAIYQDNTDGLLLGRVKIPCGKNWATVSSELSGFQPGVHNLYIVLESETKVELNKIFFY